MGVHVNTAFSVSSWRGIAGTAGYRLAGRWSLDVGAGGHRLQPGTPETPGEGPHYASATMTSHWVMGVCDLSILAKALSKISMRWRWVSCPGGRANRGMDSQARFSSRVPW